MAEALLRRPFDHYGRYRLAAEFLTAVAPDGGLTALDVGGGPGSLAAFAPATQVVASDVVRPEGWFAEAPSLVLADGAALPMADGAFDVVVTLDTLEHVPPARRAALLSEVVRVARGWALVVCPCATPGVADADRALLAVVRRRFGEDFPTTRILTEHLAFGHPDPDRVRATLQTQGVEVVQLPSGRLDRWLPMMLVFYDLLALGDDEPVELVQAAYNRVFWADDLRAPAYRQAFLCRAPGTVGPSLEEVAAVLSPRAPPEPADLSVVSVLLGAGFAGLLQSEREQTVALRAALERARDQAQGRLAEVEALDDRVRAAEDRVNRAEADVAALSAFRDEVLAHPLVRLRRATRRVLRRPGG